jgi:hypothetical protein
MKSYCLDTSGLSNPLEFMPEDIHPTLWQRIADIIVDNRFAATVEVYEELTHIQGPIGDCIRDNRLSLALEVDDAEWDGLAYLGHTNRMQTVHEKFIAEFNQNRKGMIGLTDLSIIALGKTLRLPVISMEKLVTDPNSERRKIPNICALESVEHLTFNDFLRREGIVL